MNGIPKPSRSKSWFTAMMIGVWVGTAAAAIVVLAVANALP